jgi:hypothetical protein
MKTEIYPLPVPLDLYNEIRTAAKKSGLSIADIMRQSLKAGFPRICEQLGTGRVTNVDPLPDKVLRKLYAERDDDEEGIRKFMAAQSKAVQE